jgi:hypothetical protein
MRDMKRVITLLLFCCSSLVLISRAEAVPISTSASTVMSQQTFFYGNFGSGDVIFRMTTNSQPQCFGYWLRGTDSGLKNELAALLVAISSQSQVVVDADDAVLWTGSSNHYCAVSSLVL